MNKILQRSAMRYIVHHPLQLVLSILGIALGVAVVISIDLANSSSAKAFNISMENIAGKATHQITGNFNDLHDSVYTYLKIKGKISAAAPIVEANVKAIREPKHIFTFIGVDPFAEKPFRSYISKISSKLNPSLRLFMTKPSAVLISVNTAKEMGIKENDTLTIKFGGSYKKVFIIGFIYPEDEHSKEVLKDLMIADISTAQEILNMQGKLSRIDLIIPDDNHGKEIIKRIKNLLPAGLSISRSQTRTQIASDMVKAFDINLTALSLLALIVGMFLIYNTMTFSVVQRKRYIGLLRSIGVTQKEIFRIFLFEALIQAFIGTILGLLLGVILAKAIVQILTRTINDLYFYVSVNELNISLFSLLKGFLLGMGATMLAALKPSYEASSVPAGITLNRSEQELKLKKKVPRLSVAGVCSLFLGVIIFLIPSKSILLSYAGILPLIIGFSLLTPLMIILLMKLIKPAAGLTFGSLGKIAAMSIVRQISRTGVAVAALSIAVSSTVAIGTMISSFRQTVVQWLEGSLKADIYISPPSLVLRESDTQLDSSLVKKILMLPEVEDYDFYTDVSKKMNSGQINLLALKIGERSFRNFKFKGDDALKIWPAFQNKGELIITEPFAFKNNIKTGDYLRVSTEKGERRFRVAGIYYDYSSDIGFAVMSFTTYKHYWNDNSISGLSLYLKDPSKLDSIINVIQHLNLKGEEVLLRSNNKLRNASIEVFDRTFLITNVLQILAIIVAFIGVLSSLMALQLERSREFAILRANGLTPVQLWRLLVLQTGLMGIVSGILALPLGNVLAWVLIHVINKRSFGWTLQYSLMPEVLVQALAIALLAALLAGFYPAYKMSRTSPALALRDE
ncbi:MAG: FtsX-like permease family protein [Bacteroidota bacterium]|nr:FtsX-like permease family protein [Bacteroidota bacterium]MDP4193421.1 FtsX-like permease family protein [Bacteroidota bacterium]